MWRPDDLRFVFVTGKGGVGKSTVTAAMAQALSQRGKRVLIAMCHSKERLSTMLGSPPIGSDIVPVGERIWAVNIDPERALQEYGAMMLKVKVVYQAVFHNRVVLAFFKATPGMSEWSMLGKAWFHSTETDKRGQNRFDVVLLDAPATGHGLDMLRVPKVILDAMPPGILRRDAALAWEMFRDPKRTAVVLVTLPEEMPVTETLELSTSIQGELGLPLGAVVVNRVLTPLFTPDEQTQFATHERSSLETGDPVFAAVRRAAQEMVQAESLARLGSSLGLTRIDLPYLFQESASKEAILELARRF